MRTVQNRMKNHVSHFSDFIFRAVVDIVLEIHRKITNFELKNDHI